MPKVDDIAKYILEKSGEITTMKLQKLVYYSQAWSLVWDEAPLFNEEIQAWANGPVVPDLYRTHKGEFKIKSSQFEYTCELKADQKETLDAVFGFYGDMTSQRLVDLTHVERPWHEARKGLAGGERGSKVITHASMAEYYSSL